MRFERLVLQAYGAYAGRTLGFPAAPDFHVVYGPNEAGKSTTLRALIALLFGIEERTPDNFRFGYDRLRVGAVLRAADGTSLAVMRRKGRKSTLSEMDPETLAERGVAVPEASLSAMLGGLSQSLYTSMFGLDYERLVEGGRALVEGRGEVGEVLFEAGAGLASIRALRRRLGAECESLFKRQASNPEINRALREYGDARREARDRSVRSSEWQERRKSVDEARRRHQSARDEHERLLGETRKLERLRDLLPSVALRAQRMTELAALADVPRLALDANAQRVAAESAIAHARESIAEAEARVARARDERDRLGVRDDVLREAAQITSLYHATSNYRTARDARTVATATAARAEREARSLLATIAAGTAHGDTSALVLDARALLPDSTSTARIEALAADAAAVRTELTSVEAALAEQRSEAARIDAELHALGTATDTSVLAAFVEWVAALGDPESRAGELERETAQEEGALERAAVRLGAPSIRELVALRAPGDAEIEEWEGRFAALDSERATLATDTDNVERDLADAVARITALSAGGATPTVERLHEARCERDRLWRAIRLRHLPEPGDPAPTEPAPAAATFEHSLHASDFVADALFADAQRATQLAELRTRERQMREGIEAKRAALAALDARRTDLQRQWAADCVERGLPAREVRTVRRWLADRAILVQKDEVLQRKREEVARFRELSANTRARLDVALAATGLARCEPGERLAQGLSRARTVLKQAAGHEGARTKLAGEAARTRAKIGRLEAQRNDAVAARERWGDAWREAMGRLRLADEALPDEARARMRELAALREALDAFDRETRRANEQGATVEAFEAQAFRLAGELRVDVDDRAADTVAETLHAVLQAATKGQGERERLDQQIRGDTELVDREQRKASDGERRLAALVVLARCADASQLQEIETRDARRRGLESELSALEAEIARISGMPLADALAAAEGKDIAEVEVACEVAERDRKRAAETLERTVTELDAARAAFEAIDGTSAAALAEQQAAEHGARLGTLATRYASARLASAILGRVVDDYQLRNQGPIVRRASELYREITGGAFAQVVVDFDEDRQVLVAVRPNGERLGVDALSTGRRDQLFLALRLGAIERHLEAGEPMPVVVDDLLVQFDDEAAGATLRMLAALSGKTQVLFFTHHEHLVEAARAAVGSAGFVGHRIAATSAEGAAA